MLQQTRMRDSSSPPPAPNPPARSCFFNRSDRRRQATETIQFTIDNLNREVWRVESLTAQVMAPMAGEERKRERELEARTRTTHKHNAPTHAYVPTSTNHTRPGM